MRSIMDQDTSTFFELVSLASAGAQSVGREVAVSNWERLIHLAVQQNVTALIGCALMNSPELNCPDAIETSILNSMRTEASKNMIRCQRLLSLLMELEMQGIKVLLLKGYAIARYYKYPECRGSVDTDILVPIDKEEEVYAFLREKGFTVLERASTSHHGICYHKKYGKVEVHTRLYDEIVEEVWLQGMDEKDLILEKTLKISAQGGYYHTLGPTDEFIFLSLHMIKHFIENGISIRMILDIALFYANNHHRIDLERYRTIVNKLHYGNLMKAVFGIAEKYAGMECLDVLGDSGIHDDMYINLVVHDMLYGGYMGQQETSERHESGMEYNRYVILKRKSRAQYIFYMLKWKVKSGISIMFPSCNMLYTKYPVLRNRKYLFPFVWIYNFFKFPIKKVRSGVLKSDIRSDATELNDIAKRRVSMFKQLGMLD